jgi:3D-(3,5/4)-trihydroxycyclohexane-1,2-dione acylhydrolase (decyclizing)
MNIDYAAIAEAYGCKANRVKTPQELEAAIEDAKRQALSTFNRYQGTAQIHDGRLRRLVARRLAEVSEKPAVNPRARTLRSICAGAQILKHGGHRLPMKKG